MNERDCARSIGAVIALKRRAMGLTQQQLGELIDIETESVSRLETGATSPTLKRILQLSALFNCSLTEFFQFSAKNNIENAAIIADMLKDLPPEEQKSVVKIVAKIIKMMQKPAG